MIPEFIEKINNELIAIDGELCMLKVDLIPFPDFPSKVKQLLEKELEDDTIAQASLDLLGIKSYYERLHKFGVCRYGGFDNKADFNAKSGKHTPEYYDCGIRGKCPVEGKLCKHVQAENGYITPTEIKVIKLIAMDYADKQIADKLGISNSTVHTHRRNIQKKVGCNSKVGICRFGVQKNII